MPQVRIATLEDAGAITDLMDALGYPGTGAFIPARIAQILSHPDAVLLVAEANTGIVGVISLHFVPQLALAGDFCRINYLCVSAAARGQGIGQLLEAHAVALASSRGCDRMELHCHARRTEAHRFYRRQGYAESPKYLCKSLSRA